MLKTHRALLTCRFPPHHAVEGFILQAAAAKGILVDINDATIREAIEDIVHSVPEGFDATALSPWGGLAAEKKAAYQAMAQHANPGAPDEEIIRIAHKVPCNT